MELRVDRDERVFAPLELVWEEIDGLDQLLARTPQVSNHEPIPGESPSARGYARLAVGPIKWTVELHVKLVGLVPYRQVRYVVEGVRPQARLEVSIDLVPLGSSETKLCYRSMLEVNNKRTAQRRGLFSETAEDYADTLIDGVKAKAERRRLAQDRLL